MIAAHWRFAGPIAITRAVTRSLTTHECSSSRKSLSRAFSTTRAWASRTSASACSSASSRSAFLLRRLPSSPIEEKKFPTGRKTVVNPR
jgi:hypothetical protein